MAEYNWADMHKHATTSLEGEFPLVIVEATATRTSDQSKDMIKWKAKIETGPYVDRPISGQFVISPDSPVAMRILFTHWSILGLDSAFFAANPNASVEQIAQALVGRRAIGVIGTRTWQGRDMEEIREWKPALAGPGGGTGPLGGGVLTPLIGSLSSPLASPGTPGVVPSTPSPAPASAAPAQPQTDAPALPF